jgi:hypothetical protein
VKTPPETPKRIDSEQDSGETLSAENAFTSLLVLIDAFGILFIIMVIIVALLQVVQPLDVSVRKILEENQGLQEKVEQLQDKTSLQFERIATLEKTIRDQTTQKKPGKDGKISTVVVTRKGTILFEVTSGSRRIQVENITQFGNWLKKHKLSPTVQIAGEQGADYQMVTRTAEFVRAKQPQTSVYFGAGIRTQ